ncbi:Schizosaccharomyces specific protein Mug166 [Schizosaccharomyces osmophilus]|uniref:Schizosaccharomyces specific protein Mug166 n=1 Tax=Schizosaccharomyces osmophilus TaxID=2545709 RepID=A0AAF0AU64_9SCHI|nr:Schizosaccharomyces specific protein Mug166 [Schizosaccharomyces osmophilus]WBW70640.1 Schizosaccharomyces specific protein Mug166 [Schizosaccharomyces osmophilus]
MMLQLAKHHNAMICTFTNQDPRKGNRDWTYAEHTTFVECFVAWEVIPVESSCTSECNFEMPRRTVLFRGNSFVSFSTISSGNESSAHGDDSLGQADEPLTSDALGRWTSWFNKKQTKMFHEAFVNAYIDMQQKYAELESLQRRILCLQRVIAEKKEINVQNLSSTNIPEHTQEKKGFFRKKPKSSSSASSSASSGFFTPTLDARNSATSREMVLNFSSIPYSACSAASSPASNISSAIEEQELYNASNQSLESQTTLLQGKAAQLEEQVNISQTSMHKLLRTYPNSPALGNAPG